MEIVTCWLLKFLPIHPGMCMTLIALDNDLDETVGENLELSVLWLDTDTSEGNLGSWICSNLAYSNWLLCKA